MTSNQIAYWNLQETERANRAQEHETNRANLARETEQNRTNLANEAIRQRANEIQEAQNMRMYSVSLSTLAEQQRSNVAKEAVQNREADIKAKEADTHSRQASVQEALVPIQARQADASIMQGSAALMNAATNADQLQETKRANLASEFLRYQQQDEVHRSNIAQENIARFQNATGYSNKAEQLGIEQQKANEQSRHNTMTEAEQKRANLIEEQLKTAGLMYQMDKDTKELRYKYSSNLMPKLSIGGIK